VTYELFSYSVSDSTATNISKTFTHKMAAKTSWHRYGRNYVTVTVCIMEIGVAGMFDWGSCELSPLNLFIRNIISHNSQSVLIAYITVLLCEDIQAD